MRRILLQFEQTSCFTTSDACDAYHVALLRDRGFVEAKIVPQDGFPREAVIFRLTDEGHKALQTDLEFFKGVLETQDSQEQTPSDREHLKKLRIECEKFRDDTLRIVSTGGIGLAFSVAGFLITNGGVEFSTWSVGWLILAIVSWSAVIVLLLWSTIASQKSIDLFLDGSEGAKKADSVTGWLNVLNIILVCVGIAAFAGFLLTVNSLKVKTMEKETWKVSGFYREKRIESWREFDEYAAHTHHAVYRGQANAKWSLMTGYERVERVQCPMLELGMIRNFSSQAGLYASDLPARTDYVSWLSLMQHYGAGTRLLDVTRSRYVALFFAVTEMWGHNRAMGKNEDCWDGAVWVFKTDGPNRKFYNRLLIDESTGCIDLRATPFAQALAEYKELGWRFANHFIVSDMMRECIDTNDEIIRPHLEHMKPFVHSGGIVELIPQKVNMRMVAQAAEFLMPITLRKPFECNLEAWADLFASEEYFPVEKLIIPKEMMQEIRGKLREMNINYQTLFPDLTGLARQVNYA